jgi:phosphomannomutase
MFMVGARNAYGLTALENQSNYSGPRNTSRLEKMKPMNRLPPKLAASVDAWISGDPDPVTRAELERLVAAGDDTNISERMAGSLAFGTAGLRGAVSAGSNRMNRAVVIRTTRGLADYLLRRFPDMERPLVIVGCDARLSSAQFLSDTVDVLTAAGISVRFFPDPTPTPIVVFTSLLLGGQAAVVVTASHNPPQDNGYKLYDANGAQIIPPVDRDIATAIDAVASAADVPRIQHAMDDSDLATEVPLDVFERYLDALAEVRSPPPGECPQLRFVHTPIHGVGGAYVTAALAAAGYHDVHPVEEQFTPDGNFPTVSFPNPEEPGALDLALRLAEVANADAILANDPDTDRLAVALPHNGIWTQLTGNQVGVLLGDFMLEHTSLPKPIVINSVVSSPMLADIASAYGARFVQTLTGFKWIWNAAMDLEESDAGTFVFGYEEALGYSVGPAVRDKDGISALVVFADLIAWEATCDSTVWDRLERLYRRHGLWVSTQKSVVRPGSEGAAEIANAMERIGAAIPERLGGHRVVGATDYRSGAEERPRYLPATSLVSLNLGNAGRVLVRPSGTEPKIKVYVDLRADLVPGDDAWSRYASLLDDGAAIASELANYLGFD